jgi:pyruvate dehydrogenase E2 component (dihydrolipoamide acetyltransferase)
MEEGRFVGWLQGSGKEIAVGQPLFEMEGEKAVQEIEAVESGRLFIPENSPKPDTVVAVGTLLGYLLAPGEMPPNEGSGGGAGAPEATVANAAVTSVENEPPPVNSSDLLSSDTVLSEIVEHRHASPRARRAADGLGIDWQKVSGTGRGGRVRERDVLAYGAQLDASPSERKSVEVSSGLSPRRKVIAERLRRSLSHVIPVTLTTKADVTKLVALREQFKSAQAKWVPSYTDMLAKLLTGVLTKHPQVSVRWNEEHTAVFAVGGEGVDIGIAVDTAAGLLVPVVRGVETQTLVSITQQTQELIGRARAGRLSSRDAGGAVTSLTNLGAFGIDAFTPIINFGEVTILGMGCIRREPVFTVGDRVESRQMMTLSLTFDHAVVDGAPAAAFLRDLVAAIEDGSGLIP